MKTKLIRFKTLKMLKKEYEYKIDSTGDIRIYNSTNSPFIVSRMHPFFDGEEHEIIIVHEGEYRMEIRIPSITGNDSWSIHKEWIDNLPKFRYNSIDKLFKEEL